MKKRRTISFIIACLACFYQTSAQDNKILPRSIYFTQFSNNDSIHYFNAFDFSKNIKLQLKPYNLVIYNANEIRDGRFLFSIDYFGKRFFKDYYIVYKNDLSKHLPKPPDLTKGYFINH